MNIVSIFSGRKQNIEVLKKYLEKALELKIIHEVHFWNITRNCYDENYLKSISNLKRTSSSEGGNYISITPTLLNNCFELNGFELNVKASNDIHIKISDLEIEYEIVLGGWDNTKSVIRENDTEIFDLLQNNVADGSKFNNFKIMVNKENLYVFKNNELLISQKIKNNFKITNIYFKTGHNSIGELTYHTTQNKGFYFMDTCEKSWKNYYKHYNNKNFENDIIIKCDDDIVFIDLYKLPKFIDFIRNNDYDLVFANTINNGVSAYYQQNKFNLIPKDLMDLEYPNTKGTLGLDGSLWESHIKAENLHNYFIDNYEKFLDHDYNNEIIPIKTRFSINFFGYKGKNWHKIHDCYTDDEYNLTIEYVQKRDFNNVLYTNFYVSHLSFHKQFEQGMDLDKLIYRYNNLYYTMRENGRFECKND